jgi:hypothetical protein
MKNTFIAILLLSVFTLTGCSSPPTPKPLDVGDKLILSAEHPFMVPPEGIRFSNGATIGVVQ